MAKKEDPNQTGFDFKKPRDETHPEGLERVSTKIARYILLFCKARAEGARHEFHMDELVAYVKTQVPETAPDSSSRIMRDLRQKGKLRYTLVSRRDSRYRIDP